MSNETKGSWREAVAALLVIIFLVRVGGWLLPAVIAAVLFMVVGHEFGHYITAKWTGMKVTEYFVGFGPRLWSFRRGETEYGIKALPLGGYVKIVGMSSLEQIDDADEPRSYRAQTYPRRVLVASAGSLMHALMALVVLVFTFAVLGMPDASRVDVSSFTKWDGHAKNAAQVAGFQRGDEILSVSKGSTDKPVAISDASTFVSIVQHASGEQLRFAVRRDGATRVLIATPVDGRTITSGGEHFAAPTGPCTGCCARKPQHTRLAAPGHDPECFGRRFADCQRHRVTPKDVLAQATLVALSRGDQQLGRPAVGPEW